MGAGDEAYYATVAIPSVIANIANVSYYVITGTHIGHDASGDGYYRLPWEADADDRSTAWQMQQE
jgi:hypothetical protein